MSRAYQLFGWAVVVLGGLHMFAALQHFEAVTGEALWFFSGGMLLVLAGTLNLLNRVYSRIAPGLRRVCIGTNIAMTLFGAIAGRVTGATAGEFLVVLVLLAGITTLSLSSRSHMPEWKE
jgi:hypothetical protein